MLHLLEHNYRSENGIWIHPTPCDGSGSMSANLALTLYRRDISYPQKLDREERTWFSGVGDRHSRCVSAESPHTTRRLEFSV